VPRTVRDVVFVDGVRTPFGKAGPKGIYHETRADDLVVKAIRELLRRNPGLDPKKIDEVAIAATTQIGDQGLTLGRTAGILAVFAVAALVFGPPAWGPFGPILLAGTVLTVVERSRVAIRQLP
jgi:hypothetical protein